MNIRRAWAALGLVFLLGVAVLVGAQPNPLPRQSASEGQVLVVPQAASPSGSQSPAKPAVAPSRATSYWPPKDWPWPPEMESVKSAWRDHKILWENDKVRLIEVTIRPGETEAMHHHPYDSIFAYDSPWPSGAEAPTDKKLVQDDPRNRPFGGRAGPPPGKQFPTCASAGPQAPHQATNHGSWPLHFYRIEFKRVDGDGLYTNWKQWYPWMLDPEKPVKDLVPGTSLGPPFSKDFPYPFALDSVHAAPNNHSLHYEDDHVRFLEVAIRPGETENLHGHPYPSVFANDSIASVGEMLAGATPVAKDYPFDPHDPRNASIGGVTPGPPGEAFPTCTTMDPQAPHRGQDIAAVPIHFYRLEFKRIDGDDIKTKWKQWYSAKPKPPSKTGD